MSFQYDTNTQEKPTAQEESQFWAQQLARYLAPTTSGWMPIWINEWSAISRPRWRPSCKRARS